MMSLPFPRAVTLLLIPRPGSTHCLEMGTGDPEWLPQRYFRALVQSCSLLGEKARGLLLSGVEAPQRDLDLSEAYILFSLPSLPPYFPRIFFGCVRLCMGSVLSMKKILGWKM